MPTADILQ